MGKLTRSVFRTIIIDGQPVTTSRAVAESFGKRHDNVIASIRKVECSEAFRLLNFKETPYTLEQNGETYTEFQITRDGLMLLVMGFTGKIAAQAKEGWIAEFNRRGEELAKKQQKRALAGMKSARSAPKSGVNKPLFLAYDTASMIGKNVPEVPASLDIPRDLIEAVDARAMALAAECLPALRSYLRRAMVHRSMYGGVTMPVALDDDRARAALASSGLADALAFEASRSLRAIKSQAAVISQVVAHYAREIEAIPA